LQSDEVLPNSANTSNDTPLHFALKPPQQINDRVGEKLDPKMVAMLSDRTFKMEGGIFIKRLECARLILNTKSISKKPNIFVKVVKIPFKMSYL
jgi:hypothetical protein